MSGRNAVGAVRLPVEVVEVVEPVGRHRATVLWLHGLGQGPESLVEVADRLELDRAGIRGVFPQAPLRPIGRVSGDPVRAWFEQDVFALENPGPASLPGVLAIERRLRAVLDEETARVGPGRTVVAGFSQGALMALVLALRYPQRLAGLALYAPFLPDEAVPLLASRRSAVAVDLPVWIGHGAFDWIIPEQSGAKVRDVLADWGHPVGWQRYRAGHEAFGGVKRALPDFLERVLGSDGG
ncbi:phospholipase/carboxylesterase [Streptomyces sp. TLI_053]|nr:phospholipase/carboxylesterase [Streptomyces sp. TLI_053]